MWPWSQTSSWTRRSPRRTSSSRWPYRPSLTTPRVSSRSRTASTSSRALRTASAAASRVVVSRFNGDITTGMLEHALAALRSATSRDDAITVVPVPGRVRAAADGARAREDPPLCVRGRARLHHPRRDAALRPHRRRGGKRPPAGGDRDRHPGVVRRPDVRHARAGRGPDRPRRRSGAYRARDGRSLLACTHAAGRRASARRSRPRHVEDLRSLREEAGVRAQPEPLDGGDEASLRPEPPARSRARSTGSRRGRTSARAACAAARSPKLV